MALSFKRYAVLAGAALVLAATAAPAAAPQPALTDLQGEPFLLDDYRGRVVLLNFWATWCAPCLREMPELDRVAGEIDPERAVVLGVAADDPDEVSKFVEKLRIGYRVASGNPDDVFAWTAALGNAALGLPFSVLLDAAGDVRWLKSGGTVTAAEVTALIDQQLREQDQDK